jgi:hypothetical protein
MRRPSLLAKGEGNTNAVDMRDGAATPWSKAVSRTKSCYRNLGRLVIDHKPALVRIGKAMSRIR